MLSLIWKDIHVNRSQLLVPLGMGAAMFLAAAVSGEPRAATQAVGLLGAYSLMICPFFALGSMAVEDKNHTLGFLRTMPLSPGSIVTAKFLTVMLVGVITAAMYSVVGSMGQWIASARGGTALAEAGWSPLVLVVGVAATLPFTGISMVVFFKWGQSAARSFMLAAYGVLFLGYMVIGPMIPDWKHVADRLSQFVSNPDAATTLAVTAVALAAYFAEMIVGQQVFRGKELA